MNPNGFHHRFPTENLLFLNKENSNLSQTSFDHSPDAFSNIQTDIGSLKKNLSLMLKEIRIITSKLKENEDYEAEGVVLANPESQKLELILYKMSLLILELLLLMLMVELDIELLIV
jgi:hypothetical protein